MSGEKMPLPNEIYASLESLSSVEEQVGAETYLGAETGQLGSPLIKKSAKIMIVDDEPICIKALRKYLRDSGYETFLTTNNSSEAFAMMKAASPDILLLDYMMPEVDGIEILKMRYHDAEIIHIPVLMLTASREGSVKVKALDLGATDF